MISLSAHCDYDWMFDDHSPVSNKQVNEFLAAAGQRRFLLGTVAVNTMTGRATGVGSAMYRTSAQSVVNIRFA